MNLCQFSSRFLSPFVREESPVSEVFCRQGVLLVRSLMITQSNESNQLPVSPFQSYSWWQRCCSLYTNDSTKILLYKPFNFYAFVVWQYGYRLPCLFIHSSRQILLPWCLIHTYIHTNKQIYIAPKLWKRIRGAGAGWLDSESRLEEVWL